MRRRHLLAAFPILVLTRFGLAQPLDTARKVAVLFGSSRQTNGQHYFMAFRERLMKLGWTEGQNIVVTPYWGEGDAGAMQAHAVEMVRSRPDVIAVQSATALRAVSSLAADIPIVFFVVSDPVGNKFVQSLSRPGGNVTGFSLFDYEIVGRWLQLLKEIVPNLKRVLLLMNTGNPNWPGWLGASKKAFRALGIQLVPSRITSSSDIQSEIAAVARQANSGLIVLPDPFLGRYRRLIVEAALKHRLPAIHGVEADVEQGGLIFYGTDNVDMAGRAAEYVSRILRGERPKDMPVQMPSKFRLVVNLGAAKSLGIAIPPSLLQDADKVIS